MSKDPQNKSYNKKKVEKCLTELEENAQNLIAFADGSAAVHGEPLEVGKMIVAAMIADPTIQEVIIAAASFTRTEEYRLLRAKAMQAVMDKRNLN